jgi:hypothetical protein
LAGAAFHLEARLIKLHHESDVLNAAVNEPEARIAQDAAQVLEADSV